MCTSIRANIGTALRRGREIKVKQRHFSDNHTNLVFKNVFNLGLCNWQFTVDVGCNAFFCLSVLHQRPLAAQVSMKNETTGGSGMKGSAI